MIIIVFSGNFKISCLSLLIVINVSENCIHDIIMCVSGLC